MFVTAPGLQSVKNSCTSSVLGDSLWCSGLSHHLGQLELLIRTLVNSSLSLILQLLTRVPGKAVEVAHVFSTPISHAGDLDGFPGFSLAHLFSIAVWGMYHRMEDNSVTFSFPSCVSLCLSNKWRSWWGRENILVNFNLQLHIFNTIFDEIGGILFYNKIHCLREKRRLKLLLFAHCFYLREWLTGKLWLFRFQFWHLLRIRTKWEFYVKKITDNVLTIDKMWVFEQNFKLRKHCIRHQEFDISPAVPFWYSQL